MSVIRRYSEKTIKQLFGQSGNQCAFPGCTNAIVAPGDTNYEAAVIGQVCHIYAASDAGPRGNPQLSERQRNLPSNLILLCAHHHAEVDKQPEKFPASLLLTWKTAHEAKYTPRTAEAVKEESHVQRHAFLERLTDKEIEEALDRLCKARFLAGFATREEALRLATRVEQSELSAGSSDVRARALAWCARILSFGADSDRAWALWAKSNELAHTQEGAIAHAFLTAAKDKMGGRVELGAIGTPAAKSAALRMVMNTDGMEAALEWCAAAGLSQADFDAEGKSSYLHLALITGRWDILFRGSDELTDGVCAAMPSLLNVKAMARLLSAVPDDLKALVASGIPFESDSFPLGAGPRDISARREAMELFGKLGDFADSIGLTQAAHVALDYSLWLELRDPDQHDAGMAKLRDSMRDPIHSLRRLHFALQFGLKVDIAAIERRIDQSVAMTGQGTADEAFARYSLALTKKSPKEVAEYLAKHRVQLDAHLRTQGILATEIEALAKAGMTEKAKERLAEAASMGLSTRDQEMLRHIIAVHGGADPVAEFREAFEASPDDHRVLSNFVDALDSAKRWEDMLPYARLRFQKTRAVEDAFPVAKALNELDRHEELFQFLEAQQGLLDQSANLRTLWAGALYREGRFSDARAVLATLKEFKDSRHHRALRVDIDIASGNWNDLVTYCSEVWGKREKFSGTDLLQAAQIAQVVNSSHARELIEAAAEKSADDPAVLASAYFQATRAGWEQNAVTAGWMQQAAALSNDEGPIQTMSLQDLFDRKPEWDKQANSAWELLNAGKLPVFGAAQLMNKTLLEYFLLPAIANREERDVRKRNVIYAYSGARGVPQKLSGDKIAIDYAALLTLSFLGLLEVFVERYSVVIPHATLSWLFHERQQAAFHQPSRIRDAHSLKQLLASESLRVFDGMPAPEDQALAGTVGPDLASMISAAKRASEGGKRSLVVRSAPIHRLGSLMEEEADVSAYAPWIVSCSAVVDWMQTKGALLADEERKARAYLKLQERAWPNEPTIEEGTELYLDSLSISHLRVAGVLGKFRQLKARVFISRDDSNDADGFIEIENLTSTEFDHIDAIQKILAVGLASGRVRAVRSRKIDPDKMFQMHPSYNILGLAEAVDAILIDDRYINQHATMTIDDRKTPLLSTLDILDMLRESGAINEEALLGYRTYLRQAGYQLIPLRREEIRSHIQRASIADGALIETAELRAMRESLLRARMSTVVQLPLETMFLHGTLAAIIFSMRDCWSEAPDTPTAVARADWLLGLADVRGWAASAIKGGERNLAIYGYAAYLLQIISAPINAESGLRGEYFKWVTDRVLEGVKEYQPEAYSWIVARAKELTLSGVDEGLKEMEVL